MSDGQLTFIFFSLPVLAFIIWVVWRHQATQQQIANAGLRLDVEIKLGCRPNVGFDDTNRQLHLIHPSKIISLPYDNLVKWDSEWTQKGTEKSNFRTRIIVRGMEKPSYEVFCGFEKTYQKLSDNLSIRFQ